MMAAAIPMTACAARVLRMIPTDLGRLRVAADRPLL
jgi:hypothetical protein